MAIFDFSETRTYLRHYIDGLPQRGRGELTRMAQHLRVNTTLLSQILAGTRQFTPEQAFELSQYLGHSRLEAEYFSLLVQLDRTSHKAYRERLLDTQAQLRSQALKLVQRVQHKKALSPEERSVFYSSWIYSAVHALSSLYPKGMPVEAVMERFRLPRDRAQSILVFLSQAGLLREADFRYFLGTSSTFIEHGSPELIKHTSNWRVKALAKSETLTAQEMMFSAQVSVSRADFLALRERLVEVIQVFAKTIESSQAEDLAVLNLDWFWLE